MYTVQYTCTVYRFEDVPQNVCCYILPLSERIAIPSASISVSTYIQWVLVFKVGLLVMKLIIRISVYGALVSGVYTYIYIMDKIKLVVYIYT